MNQWFHDPRTKAAQLKTLDAERAERRRNPIARTMYREAAELFGSVAVGVPADHPNTRSDLAIAAVACFARSGDFGGAVDFANQMLAQFDALSPHGRSELARLAEEYAKRLVSTEATPMIPALKRFPTLPTGRRAQDVRAQTRDRARHPASRSP